MNITKYHRKRLAAVFLFCMLAFTMSAQEKADSVFTFRFYSGKDMFYVPVLNNGEELKKLFDIVEQYKEKISGNEISVRVDGFYISTGSKAEKYGTAKIRSNRVKSELITRKGLIEDNFVTRNQAGNGNFVTVRFFDINNNEIFFTGLEEVLTTGGDAEKQEDASPGTPVEKQEDGNAGDEVSDNTVTDKETEATAVATETTEKTETTETTEATEENREKTETTETTEATEENREKTEKTETTETTEENREKTEKTETTETTEETAEETDRTKTDRTKTDSRLALKTNLLGYAVLMPNAEIEWMFVDRWSAALEVQGAWYAKESDPRKVYRLSYVAPEVRYWAIERSRWHGMYVGVFGGVGMYDLDNRNKSNKGHEGEGVMAGLSVGYMWPVSKRLSLEAGTGVGYLRLRDKVYTPLDGHFLYQLTKNINYFGPLRLKLSLVWRFQSDKNRSAK